MAKAMRSACTPPQLRPRNLPTPLSVPRSGIEKNHLIFLQVRIKGLIRGHIAKPFRHLFMGEYSPMYSPLFPH